MTDQEKSCVGIIGGSGLYSLDDSADTESITIETPFSNNPVTLTRQQRGNLELLFLPRHGADHGLPPHKINYRANLSALNSCGVKAIYAVNVTGGINSNMPPGTIVLPDQIIDYTWGREHTCFDSLESAENHVDFTLPYDSRLRQILLEKSDALGIEIQPEAIYGCTQGPRLESAAEIAKLQRDGCDIVGMTAMPEAALARELNIPYASIAIVVNWAAGLTDKPIAFAEISAVLDEGVTTAKKILNAVLEN